MSSYIVFSIANKEKYELYNKKYDEIQNLKGYEWAKDYSSAYKLLENYYCLYYCSSSFQPYRAFRDNVGFNYKYQVLTKDIISIVLESLSEELKEVKNQLDYYEKFGTLHRNINSKKIEIGLNFIEEISIKINNPTQIDNLKSILINADLNDKDDEESIAWIKEEYEDLKQGVTVLSFFELALNCLNHNEVIIFCFD